MTLFRSILKWLFGKRKPPPPGDGGRPELLIVGLGNPGPKYDNTRHNIGFDVINELYARAGENVGPPDEYCEAVCGMIFQGAGRKPALLVKPLTFMNLSGKSVAALLRKYGLAAERCFVIVDDFNIPLGKIRFRKEGSHGGHNGLKSISETIGDGYPRLRMGIGPLPAGVAVIDFVLGRFCDQELEEVERVKELAAEAVTLMIESGIDVAMNKYN